MHGGLERMEKAAVVIYFKVSIQNFMGGTEENH
jgi:hypothetical protein